MSHLHALFLFAIEYLRNRSLFFFGLFPIRFTRSLQARQNKQINHLPLQNAHTHTRTRSSMCLGLVLSTISALPLKKKAKSCPYLEKNLACRRCVCRTYYIELKRYSDIAIYTNIKYPIRRHS